VGLTEQTSNQLFDILQDWETDIHDASDLLEPLLTKPRWRSQSLCNHEIASDGRAILLQLSHGGGQIGRDHSQRGWRFVPQ
jgi:hypothetical protein